MSSSTVTDKATSSEKQSDKVLSDTKRKNRSKDSIDEGKKESTRKQEEVALEPPQKKAKKTEDERDGDDQFEELHYDREEEEQEEKEVKEMEKDLASEVYEPPEEAVKLVKRIRSKKDMQNILSKYGRAQRDFHIGLTIVVNDKMQSDYSYVLSKKIGEWSEEFPDFEPAFTPAEILKYGAFEGKYLNDCLLEFPREWFLDAMDKLSPEKPDESVNQFGIKSRLNLGEWKRRNWLPAHDVRGWFQWYCRFYMGRRDPSEDRHQVNRWKQYKRHLGQIKAHCQPGDLSCRTKQRQGLLQWAHNAFI